MLTCYPRRASSGMGGTCSCHLARSKITATRDVSGIDVIHNLILQASPTANVCIYVAHWEIVGLDSFSLSSHEFPLSTGCGNIFKTTVFFWWGMGIDGFMLSRGYCCPTIEQRVCFYSCLWGVRVRFTATDPEEKTDLVKEFRTLG